MEVARASEANSFGKYTLVAKLATGGMAEIFLARLLSDGGFEKLVCIKRILPHLAKDPQFVAMFLDEARVVARISHPNVCQVFELGEIDGQYYIAMEYLAGVPLSIFRRPDYYPLPPDPRLVAGFGVQACEGLHHAHQLKTPTGDLLGVVHRDISPQNLFVTLDGIVKVLDFGIAKVQDQSAKTSTGAVKGTYSYMSPEQLRGERVDRRADVWALGTVLWECLAQRHLFKRDTEFLTFQAITSDPIPDICEIRPDVPPLVGDTIARAVSRDREARFPTARAFGEALAQAVAPLGGQLTAGAIADVIEASFQDVLVEQRTLLELARRGDNFDLEKSNLLGPHQPMSQTPVSNIRGKLAEAKAEVEHYVRAQRAIRTLEDDEISSSGFTPPPGWRAVAQPSEPNSGVTIVPASIRRPPTPIPTPAPVADPTRVDPIAEPTASAPIIIHRSSKLPWLIAIVALLAAGGAAAMLYLKQHPAPSAPPAAVPVVQIHVDPPPPQRLAVVPEIDAGVAVTEPADAAPIADEPIKKPKPVRPITHDHDRDHDHDHDHESATPAASGPPGYITIDSAPVYATIYIDGKKFGDTPLVHITLAPGHHAVRAVSPSGTTRNLSITIESGKTAPVRRVEW